MIKDKDILHKLLDGEGSPEERKKSESQVQADPALRKEYEDLARSLRTVKEGGRVPAPAFFTAEVMSKLPPRRVSYGERVREFFFRGRILRWNLASGLAAVGVVIITAALMLRLYNKPVETSSAHLQGESVIIVRLNFYAPQAARVAVAGDFNKWNVSANILSKKNGGIWTTELPLKPGVYAYMFIVDGKTWVTDPRAETYRDDGFGYNNSVLRIKT